MTLDAFIAIAEAADLCIRAIDAKPNGGWGGLCDYGHLMVFARDIAEEEGCSEAEVLARLVSESLILACSKDGDRKSIRGAWTATGWFIGSAEVRADEAYQRAIGF